MPPTLVVRADAGPKMGTGHVMRCLSLAQECRDRGGDAVFLISAPPGPLVDRLRSEGIEVRSGSATPGSAADAGEAAELCGRCDARFLIADGYHFREPFQSEIRSTGLRLLLVDDGVHEPPFAADWILNANLHSRAQDYARRSEETKLLLGPKYALLRREFRKRGGPPREHPDRAEKLLVALGGGNVLAAALTVIHGVKSSPFDVTVVAGFASGGMNELETAVSGARALFRIERNVKDMASLMAWADLAVASAGSISWEAAFMGLPSVQLVLADNQVPIAASLHEAGATFSLGRVEDVTAERLADVVGELAGSRDRRRRLAETGRTLLDGEGPRRILAELEGAA
jgi:UDP-2,4-diacetamido-2,4,6-trideoxy-beta-L-altropyranose hydrolase